MLKCANSRMIKMGKYIKGNLDLWNELTPIHARSAFYDVEGFKKGRCTLESIELEEVGDVRGKSLLHLQCHFGMDTLSWARLGANTTGVDFSDEAIALARSLSKETNLKSEFICADIYNLPEVCIRNLISFLHLAVSYAGYPTLTGGQR